MAKGWVGVDAGRAISRPKSPNKEISRANPRVRVSDERASQLGDFGFDCGAEQKEDSATRCSDDNSGRVCLVRTTRSQFESMVAAVTFGGCTKFHAAAVRAGKNDEIGAKRGRNKSGIDVE